MAPCRICRVTVFREFNSKGQPNGSSVIGGRGCLSRPVKSACIRVCTQLTLKQFDQTQTLRKMSHSSQEFADRAFRPTDAFASTAWSRNNGTWSKSMAGYMRARGLHQPGKNLSPFSVSRNESFNRQRALLAQRHSLS